MNSKIDIHIFGDGSGETIFVEFKDNKFGIIDFGYKGFIDWFNEYIKTKVDVSIEFLLWTHPHDDHTRYLSDLLNYLKNNNLKIKTFFRFPFNKFKSLAEIMDIGLEQKYEIIKSSPFTYIKTTKPKYLLDLCNMISEFINQKYILEIDKIKYGLELYPEDLIQEDLSIHCIAPTEEDIERYSNIFQQVLEKNFPTEKLYPDSCYHNIISTAIYIHFGNNNIILGGDVENPAWENAMNNSRGKNYTCCELKFLKAPHHGSETAYKKDLWDHWGKNFHTAITTYNKVNLPKPQGIQNIMNHTKNIYVLKDLHKNLLLEDKFRFLSDSLNIQNDITTASNATNHIKFTIYKDGEIVYTWI